MVVQVAPGAFIEWPETVTSAQLTLLPPVPPRQPARKPCKGCGGEKGSGAARHYCDACREARVLDKACQLCGGPKSPGRGRRLCDDCRRVVVVDRVRVTPCRKCGSVERKPRGHTLCMECNEVQVEASAARRKALRAVHRKPCAGCGKVKQPGKGQYYCKACADKRAAPRTCKRCPSPVSAPHARLCVECKAQARERELVYHREWSRQARLKYPERYREYARRYIENLSAEQRANIAERQRMSSRLRGESNGYSIDEARAAATTRVRAAQPNRFETSLSGPPMAAAIERHCALHQIGLEVIFEIAGVPSRAYRRWHSGEGITLSLADKLLIAIDRFWWEVYDPAGQRPGLFHTRQRDDVLAWVAACERAARVFDE